MKNLILKCIFALVGILGVAIALAFLPLDTFTFRNWESVLWGTDLKPTIGKFYPDKIVRRTESGDLGHGSRYQELKRDILWRTDKFGFRNDPAHTKDPSVVLVGDSNVVGTGTSQEFILSEQLSHRLNAPVFNYSPMVLDADFLRNLAAMRIKPKWVICESAGNAVPALDMSRNDGFVGVVENKLRTLLGSDLFMWFEIALDRFWKREPLRYAQGRIDSFVGVFPIPIVVGDDNMLFMKDALTSDSRGDAAIRRNADLIQKLSVKLKDLGMDFIYIPVPDKESIYPELLPKEFRGKSKREDHFVRLKRELDLRGVKSVDLYSPFREKALAGEKLYFSDDKHWNKKGIEIASELIGREIVSNEIAR